MYHSHAMYSSVASALGIYFVLLALVDANIQQMAFRKPDSDGPYSLQSWAQEPMFVDEPGWILRPRTSSENKNDDKFWVTRGRKRYLHRPPTVLDRGVRLLLENDEENSWTGRGKKGMLSSILDDDPFWVNRGKRADMLERGHFRMDDRKDEALSNAVDEVRRDEGKVRSEVGDMLGQDSYSANRGKRGALSSTLSNGDQFWVNRGKKNVQSVSENGDKFGVNRGKKNDLQSALNSGDTFWVNRGKKNDVQSLLSSKGDQFWVNRGKKNEIQSMLNGGDQFWVNRGKKNELKSLLNNGDQFWVNRGKKNEIQSMLNGGDQFWVNRGKKNELKSLLNNGDQFWVNRGKKNELQSVLNSGEQFWVNRGKKNELQSLLNNGDQFWVNRGKKGEIQSMLEEGDQFWVNRGKKSELQSMLNGGDQLWANRGKMMIGHENEFQGISDAQNPDDSNIHGKSDRSGQFKNYLSPGGTLLSSDSGWNDRLKKDPLKMMLKPDPFFVNRGKKTVDKTKSEGDTNETQTRDKPDERTKRELLWEKDDKSLVPLFQNAYWLNRGKKTNHKPENLDPFWVTRGKRMEIHNRKRRHVTSSTTKPYLQTTLSPSPGSPRQKRMAKSPRMTTSYDKDYPYKKDSNVNSVFLWWKDKPTLGEFQDEDDILGPEPQMLRRLGDDIAKVEPFWVNRGKKGVDEDDFVEDVPEKRGDVVLADVVSDLGALTRQPGETFWVARG